MGGINTKNLFKDIEIKKVLLFGVATSIVLIYLEGWLVPLSLKIDNPDSLSSAAHLASVVTDQMSVMLPVILCIGIAFFYLSFIKKWVIRLVFSVLSLVLWFALMMAIWLPWSLFSDSIDGIAEFIAFTITTCSALLLLHIAYNILLGKHKKTNRKPKS